MTILAAGQAQIRDLVIGRNTPYEFDLAGPQLWTDRDIRTNDTPRPGRNGIRAGRDLVGAQTLSCGLILTGDSSTVGSLIDALGAAWAPSDEDLELIYNVLGVERVRIGRPRRFHVDATLAEVDGTAVATLDFVATDAYSYDATPVVATVESDHGGAGIVPPFTPPFALPVGTPGIIAARNNGTARSGWSARIDGPCVNPTITLTETGQVLAFTANGGLTLTPGQWLDVDSTGSALLNGTASRTVNLSIASRWFLLAPGVNHVRFRSADNNGALTLTYRSAWL